MYCTTALRYVCVHVSTHANSADSIAMSCTECVMIVLCVQTHHREQVIENCNQAIALDPRYVKALLRRFKAHQALGHQEEAFLGIDRVHM